MQTQTSTNKQNLKFMDVPDVDKIEVFWLNRHIGTKVMEHPVAKKRALKILGEIRNTTNHLNFLATQAG